MLKREPRRKPKQTEEETVKPKEKQSRKAASQSDTTTETTAEPKKEFPAEKDNRKSDPIRRQRIDPVLQINKGPSKTKTKSTEKYLCREWRDRLYRKTVKDKRPTRTAPAQWQTDTDRESTKTVNQIPHIQRATDATNMVTTPLSQESILAPLPKFSSMHNDTRLGGGRQPQQRQSTQDSTDNLLRIRKKPAQ
jgi:hypothetical protein